MVWQDEGLFFTLGLNAIIVAVGLGVAFFIHRDARNHRILRPNRPKSTTSALFEGRADMLDISGEPVTMAEVGVQPALYLHTIKFMGALFTSLFIVTIVVCAVSGTDDYLNVLRRETDPQDCRGKSSGDCRDSAFCEVFLATVAINSTSTMTVERCDVKEFKGLADLSVQNLTPEDWRLWLVGIISSAAAIVSLIVVKRFAEEAARIIRTSFIRRAYDGLPCAGLATVGARTVLVSGFKPLMRSLQTVEDIVAYFEASPEDREELAKDLIEEEKEEDGDTAAGSKKKKKKDNEEEKASPVVTVLDDEKKNPSVNDTNNDDGAPSRSSSSAEPIDPAASDPDAAAGEPAAEKKTAVVVDLDGSTACDLVKQYLVRERTVLLREPPKDMESLMEEEKALLESLKDAVAAEKQETDPEKKPVKKKVMTKKGMKEVVAVDHFKEEIERVRGELREKIDEAPEQPLNGAVILTFEHPVAAYGFVEKYTAERGVLTTSVAEVLGHRDNVIWANLKVGRAQESIRTVLMVLTFSVLVFFWSIPVGFLGSLKNLATLPAIGPPFEWMVNNIPPTLLGIITAYLPTIVITVFNILLPTLFRFFGRVGGLKTIDAETRSVVLMCAVFSIMSGIVMQAALQGGLSQLAGVVSSPNSDTIIALIIAVVSPQGGYWFAYLVAAACIGNLVLLLQPGPLITSKTLTKLATRQAAYDAVFAPRPLDLAFYTGRHMFFFAIAMLFHGTVPLLAPFGFVYCVLAYAVWRSIVIDSGTPDERPVLNYSMVKTAFHSVLVLHLIAVTGTCLVCFLKLHIGGGVFACIAIFASAAMQVLVHKILNPAIYPTAAQVVDLYTELEDALQPLDDAAEPPYRPAYTTYAIDESAVAGIEEAEYSVETAWLARGDAPEPTGDDAAPAVVVADGEAASNEAPAPVAEPVENPLPPVTPEQES